MRLVDGAPPNSVNIIVAMARQQDRCLIICLRIIFLQLEKLVAIPVETKGVLDVPAGSRLRRRWRRDAAGNDAAVHQLDQIGREVERQSGEAHASDE